jgi:4-hydroxy-tetrahydrodipicolinate reductase
MADRFNILLVGHGRLGQLIAAAAPQAGATIAGTVDDTNAGDLADRARWRDVDVAIDASAPDAFVANLPALCALGCSLVVGTTGWQAHAADVRRQIDAPASARVVTANSRSARP